MKQHLYELHAHTCEVSPCASVTAASLVNTYIDAGYSGVVITNHFSKHILRRGEGYPNENSPWKEQVDYFLTGYQKAKEAAPEGFTVLLGMEIAFYENDNDYLVYGVTEDFLYQNENLLQMGIKDFSKLAHENGLLVYQAHPFRDRMKMTSPSLLDGIEVHNANPNHDSRNDIALQWAKKFNLKMVSGSDYHQPGGHARGGMILSEPISTNDELLENLKKGVSLILKDI